MCQSSLANGEMMRAMVDEGVIVVSDRGGSDECDWVTVM